LVAKTRFADELGGDCFGFIQKHNRFATYIGDVTGHGLPAALVMVMVNTLMDVFSDVSDDYRQLVINTNKHLKPRIKATMFMTMLMLIWDHQKKSMSFIGAGHEYLFVYRAVLGTVEKIPAGGIALGMIPDNSALIKETDLKLNVGDVVLLFSDGISEARNPEGEMYGENRLQAAFMKYASRYTSAGIIYHIASEFAEFTKDAVQEDDMSIICIKYTGEGVERSEGVEKSTNWQ
jgi:serine phosphatase RsbU (regulator of sigma subunit)